MSYVNLSADEIKAIYDVTQKLGGTAKSCEHFRISRASIINICRAFREGKPWRVHDKNYLKICLGLRRKVVDDDVKVSFNKAIQKRVVEIVDKFGGTAIVAEYSNLSRRSISRYLSGYINQIRLVNLRKINEIFYLCKSPFFKDFLNSFGYTEKDSKVGKIDELVDTKKLARIDNLKSRQANLKFFKRLEVGKRYRVIEYSINGTGKKVDYSVTGIVIDDKPRFYVLRRDNGTIECVLKNNLFTENTKVVRL